MEKTREFKIVEVKDIKTKDGRSFKAYKTVGKNGKKIDVRFVRDCNNIPKEPCTIVVLDTNCNVDETRQYPILWIKQVEEIKEMEHKSNVGKYFDEDEEIKAEELDISF